VRVKESGAARVFMNCHPQRVDLGAKSRMLLDLLDNFAHAS
jgi:hypothetical protein